MCAYPVQRRLTRVSGTFGPRAPIPLPGGGSSPSFHGGVDFTPLRSGTPLPVYAVGRGRIIIADRYVERGDRSGLDVGIRLDGDGSIWWYGHLSRVDVNVGDRVADGQQIGLMGATGLTASGGRSVTGVHLHLERHFPVLNAETDPWPYVRDERDVDGLTSSWQTGNPPADSGDAGTATPNPTPAQREEAELMAAKDDIIEAFDMRAAQIESRVRRETRPEVYYVQTDEQGRTYDEHTSPFAALVQPAAGFILPLNPPDERGRRGQIDSLVRNYRVAAFDSVAQGFPASVFWNTIKDVARGAGRIDPRTGEADGVAWARSLFEPKV